MQPLKAVWSIFDNDAHKIISKRGIEVLEEEKTKIDSIHDVSKCITEGSEKCNRKFVTSPKPKIKPAPQRNIC